MKRNTPSEAIPHKHWIEEFETGGWILSRWWQRKTFFATVEDSTALFEPVAKSLY
jgi:hypothetical protein